MLTHRQLFLQHVAQTSNFPLGLEIVEAEGVYLYEKSGKSYMDLIAGISVSNLGHRHPRVVEAIKKQTDHYLHLMVYGEYIQNPQVLLAKRLSDALQNKLDAVYFVNSGSEATEGAIKLAKRYTGRSEIVSFKQAYHGSTQGALSVMGSEVFRQAFRPLIPGHRQIRFNHLEDLSAITGNTAAVIVEAVQGEAGVILPEDGFLESLQSKCHDHGALLILDEAQTGFGRTGRLFAYQHYLDQPDILLMAKAMGGGMPLGAFMASREIMSCLTHDPVLGHITTFGGHPVCCAAALAHLDVLLEEEWIQRVPAKAELFRENLRHPAILDIRNAGLLMALVFEDPSLNQQVIQHCLAGGLITDWFLFADNCLRIAPPLIVSEEEIQTACGILLKSIEQAYAH